MKVATFSTIFNNFGIEKYQFYSEQTAGTSCFLSQSKTDYISISNVQKKFNQANFSQVDWLWNCVISKFKPCFFEKAVNDIKRQNENIIWNHKVWNITLSIIYFWNPCQILTNWFWYNLNDRKDDNFFNVSKSISIFLYKAAFSLYVLPCIYDKLSRVLYKWWNMITLAKYY